MIPSQKIVREKRDAMVRFGRATVEAIHFFKTRKGESIEVLRKYAKVDASALDSAYMYIKSAVPDLPYPTLEGMKTLTAEMARTRPEILKSDPASFIDPSRVKAVEDEGFFKRLNR